MKSGEIENQTFGCYIESIWNLTGVLATMLPRLLEIFGYVDFAGWSMIHYKSESIPFGSCWMPDVYLATGVKPSRLRWRSVHFRNAMGLYMFTTSLQVMGYWSVVIRLLWNLTGACLISELIYHTSTQFRDFDTQWNLSVSHLLNNWTARCHGAYGNQSYCIITFTQFSVQHSGPKPIWSFTTCLEYHRRCV